MQRSLMIAHFSEMIGIPQSQFDPGEKKGGDAERQMLQPTRSKITDLPKHHKQLLDFLVYFPEFLDELLAAGLEEVVTNDSVLELVALLNRLKEDGSPTPDRLLSMLPEQSGERKYVTELLISGSQTVGGSEGAREMCNELLAWLGKEKKQKQGGLLMQQIQAAQENGDQELLMKLLQQKQEMGKK